MTFINNNNNNNGYEQWRVIFTRSVSAWRLDIGVHRTEQLGANLWKWQHVDDKPQMMMIITHRVQTSTRQLYP